MNHSAPLQRTDGRWDYTRNGRATGYCAPLRELSDDLITSCYGTRERYDKHMEPLRAAEAAGKFHNYGHDTADEACECFKQYQLDNSLAFQPDRENSKTLHQCRVDGCTNMTSGSASVSAYKVWTLCPEHRNRETVESLHEVGESWDS